MLGGSEFGGARAGQISSDGLPGALVSPANDGQVLIAGCDERNGAWLSQVLGRHGYAARQLARRDDIEEAMSAGGYSMVLIDMCGPGEEGLRLAAAIRKDAREGGPNTPRVPVIALATVGCRRAIEACHFNGIDALLTVPVGEAALLAMVSSFNRRPS